MSGANVYLLITVYTTKQPRFNRVDVCIGNILHPP